MLFRSTFGDEEQEHVDALTTTIRDLGAMPVEAPGVDFGDNGTGRFVRFAYTRSMGDLEEAARRIARFCAP